MDLSLVTAVPLFSARRAIYKKKSSKSQKNQRNLSAEIPSNNRTSSNLIEPNTTKHSFYLPQSISSVTSISINSRGSNWISIPKKQESKPHSDFSKAFSSYKNEVSSDQEELSKEKSLKMQSIITGRSTYRESRSLRPLKERLNNQSFINTSTTITKFSDVSLGNEAKLELKKLEKLDYSFDFQKNLPSKMNLDDYLIKLRENNNTGMSSKNQYLTHSLLSRRSLASKKKTAQLSNTFSENATNPQLLKIFPQKPRSEILTHQKYALSTDRENGGLVNQSIREVQLFQLRNTRNENSLKNIPSCGNTVSIHKDLANKYKNNSEQIKQAIYKDLEVLKNKFLEDPLLANFKEFSTPTVGEIDP